MALVLLSAMPDSCLIFVANLVVTLPKFGLGSHA